MNILLNNKESYVRIEKSKNTSTWYEVVVHDATLEYNFVSTTFYEYISMYVDKSNKDIIMTGTTYLNSRKLETIETDLQKAQTITFGLNYDNMISYSYWYEKFEFANVVPGSIVYKQKRLNGLDTYLTHSIPKETLETYVFLKVPVEEEETIKDQLKEIWIGGFTKRAYIKPSYIL